MARLAHNIAADMKVTPIVAYGLVALLMIFGGLGLDKLRQANTAQSSALVAAKNQLATLEALSGDNPWAERFATSQELRMAVTQRLWTGQTAGVIAADLQQALRRDAGALNFNAVQVRVDPELIDVDGKDILSFEFAARAPDGKAIVSMLEAVAKNQKHIIIRDVDFSQNIRDRRPPRVAFSGIIPVKIVQADAQNQAQQAQPQQAQPLQAQPLQAQPLQAQPRNNLDPMIAPSPGQRTEPRTNNSKPNRANPNQANPNQGGGR